MTSTSTVLSSDSSISSPFPPTAESQALFHSQQHLQPFSSGTAASPALFLDSSISTVLQPFSSDSSISSPFPLTASPCIPFSLTAAISSPIPLVAAYPALFLLALISQILFLYSISISNPRHSVLPSLQPLSLALNSSSFSQPVFLQHKHFPAL